MQNLELYQLIIDNDECVMGTDTCDQVCINEPGSYNCSCNTGYSLKENGISCKGIKLN